MAHLLRLLAVAGLSMLLAGAALAQGKCDLTDHAIMVGMDAAQFSALPAGSLAIGEGCDGARICSRYFDISGCQTVDYAIGASDSPGRINFSVNPVARCDGDYELLGLGALAEATQPTVLTAFNVESAERGPFTAQAIVNFQNQNVPVSVTVDLVLETTHGWQIDHIKGASGTSTWCSDDMVAQAASLIGSTNRAK